MESVIRAVAMYLFLLLLIRFSGKRSMAQVTPFDFVLVLIISEAAQQGLAGDDYSFTNAIVLVTTLVCVDIGLSLLKQRSNRLSRLLEDVPEVIVTHGRPLRHRMDRVRVTEEEVLQAARTLHGLARMEQIRYAVVETTGDISIIPEKSGQSA